ncbi:MAG: ion transporter [Pseudomonadota bacterium]|nr:ion transporter [Pseudomonadota bacterium]
MSASAPALPPARGHAHRWRHRIYVVLEGGRASGVSGAIVDGALIALILANVLAYTLQSVPAIEHAYLGDLVEFEFVSVAIFSIEYALRLWSAVEDPLLAHHSAGRGRLAYALRPMMLIDFLAFAPSYLVPLFPFLDFRILRLFRLLRLLKIARYSPAMSTLMQVVAEERRALFASLLLLLCATVFAAASMHAVEGAIQPAIFGTIPDAMWWAITTLTTVGYGDAVPVTALGRAVAGLTMVVGFGLLALPVGIIATGFVNAIHRRDFVVTFGMLARVPLFREFDATLLGEIMNLLRAQMVAPGGIISAPGNQATAMYFIISGEVEAILPHRTVRFGPGDFFGELALLHEATRKATIVAITQCRLLALAANDFATLMGRHPELERRMEELAEERLKSFGGASDISKDEVAQAGSARDEARSDG